MDTRCISDILDRVEERPLDANCMLLWGRSVETCLGIRVVRGHICWAASPNAPRRLLDVVRDRTALRLDGCTADELHMLCQRRGVLLGEFLVNRGLIRNDELLDCLVEHMCEALSYARFEAAPPLAITCTREPRHKVPVSLVRSVCDCGGGALIDRSVAGALR